MAKMLVSIIGPHVCVWGIKNGDEPYDSKRDRLGDKALYLDGQDFIVENHNYDEEDEENGEID